MHISDFLPNNGHKNAFLDRWTGIEWWKLTISAAATVIVIVKANLSSWHCHCKNSCSSFGERSMIAEQLLIFGPSQSAWALRPPKLAATILRSLSPFITTQPKSWYSIHHFMKSRGLNRPSWLVVYRGGLPASRQSPIEVLTSLGIEKLCWFKSHTVLY